MKPIISRPETPINSESTQKWLLYITNHKNGLINIFKSATLKSYETSILNLIYIGCLGNILAKEGIFVFLSDTNQDQIV